LFIKYFNEKIFDKLNFIKKLSNISLELKKKSKN